MTHQPLVSVIMPVYNARQFLREAIESILNQTYQNFQLIIVDDYSTDTTKKIIKDYAKRYAPIITAVFLRKHKGDNAAANKGFVKAKGEFIARMDSDDIAHPQRLQKQVNFLLQHPKIIVVGSQGQVINSTGQLIGRKKFPLTHKEIYRQFGNVHPMLHPSCLFRRSLLPKRKKLYEEKFYRHDDYYTFFKLIKYGEFANLNEELISYRIHKGNSSLKNPRKRFFAIRNIRQMAVKEFDYRMSFSSHIVNFLQLLIVSILPEFCILPLYMVGRGMYDPFAQPITLLSNRHSGQSEESFKRPYLFRSEPDDSSQNTRPTPLLIGERKQG